MYYANKYVEFDRALTDFMDATRELTYEKTNESIEICHNSRVNVLRLYNDMLTKVQRNEQTVCYPG